MVNQDVTLPGDVLANLTAAAGGNATAAAEALAALFPGAASVAVGGSAVRVPVAITTAVSAAAVVVTGPAVGGAAPEAVTVEVGCNGPFLSAFRQELTWRANVSNEVIANVTCVGGDGGTLAGRRRLGEGRGLQADLQAAGAGRPVAAASADGGGSSATDAAPGAGGSSQGGTGDRRASGSDSDGEAVRASHSGSEDGAWDDGEAGGGMYPNAPRRSGPSSYSPSPGPSPSPSPGPGASVSVQEAKPGHGGRGGVPSPVPHGGGGAGGAWAVWLRLGPGPRRTVQPNAGAAERQAAAREEDTGPATTVAAAAAASTTAAAAVATITAAAVNGSHALGSAAAATAAVATAAVAPSNVSIMRRRVQQVPAAATPPPPGPPSACAGGADTDASSLRLVVQLVVPQGSELGADAYRGRLQAALDAWAAESQSGEGGAGALQLCAPTSDQVETTTEVRAACSWGQSRKHSSGHATGRHTTLQPPSGPSRLWHASSGKHFSLCLRNAPHPFGHQGNRTSPDPPCPLSPIRLRSAW